MDNNNNTNKILVLNFLGRLWILNEKKYYNNKKLTINIVKSKKKNNNNNKAIHFYIVLFESKYITTNY